jgi:RNA recognition motif-containing protein
LRTSVTTGSRSVWELRSKVAEKAKGIEAIQAQIREYRESEIYAKITRRRKEIEGLEHRLELEKESEKQLLRIVTKLESRLTPEMEIAGLEEDLANAENVRIEAQSRYARLLREQHQEAAEMEQIIRSMNPPEKTGRRRFLVGLFTTPITERFLRNAFGRFGRIESVKVLVAGIGPRKYMGQVQFFLPEDAASAFAEMHGAEFMQQRLIVRWASKQPEERTDSQGTG